MKMKITAVALIALTIMSCNTGKKATSGTVQNTDGVENTQWTMTTLEGQDLTGMSQNDQPIHFTLNSKDNKVSGYSGCNTFMGTYKIEAGNQISFSQMGMTRMACPDSKINESQVMSVFETADNFTISGDQLTLNKAKRAPLAEFKKSNSAPIVEKYWKLKTLEGKEIKMADNQEREIFFTLKSQDNRVTGFAGCNSISGEYSLEEGNRIRFSHMATTMKMCPDVQINESEFLQIFELADNYSINGDELSLNVGRRAPLAVFEAVYF